jgi:hypothetical protein
MRSHRRSTSGGHCITTYHDPAPSRVSLSWSLVPEGTGRHERTLHSRAAVTLGVKGSWVQIPPSRQESPGQSRFPERRETGFSSFVAHLLLGLSPTEQHDAIARMCLRVTGSALAAWANGRLFKRAGRTEECRVDVGLLRGARTSFTPKKVTGSIPVSPTYSS